MPIEIDRYRSAAEVDVFAHIAVSHIGQMSHGRIFIDYGIFHFHKIADFDSGFQVAVWPYMGKWADFNLFIQPGLLDLAGVDLAAVSHRTVLNHCIRTDDAIFPDDRFSF